MSVLLHIVSYGVLVILMLWLACSLLAAVLSPFDWLHDRKMEKMRNHPDYSGKHS